MSLQFTKLSSNNLLVPEQYIYIHIPKHSKNSNNFMCEEKIVFVFYFFFFIIRSHFLLVSTNVMGCVHVLCACFSMCACAGVVVCHYGCGVILCPLYEGWFIVSLSI